MKIAVIGLGYVGLPLAVLCAEKGHEVVGVTIDAAAAEKINRKEMPFEDAGVGKALKGVTLQATTDFADIKDAETILICVPTPVTDKHIPDLGPLKAASTSLVPFLQAGQLIIVESTISPGTCEDVVQPILETSGLVVGETLHLAHCPERIDPGNEKWTLETIPRVVGGKTAMCLEKAVAFYHSILDSEVITLDSLKAAEATKILENSFRDINIAFINEMAKSFDKAGIDVLEVIKGASSKPFGFLPHYPGGGVGGHCIPVDPYYLIDKADGLGFNHEFLRLARKINDSMPAYVVDRLKERLKEEGGSLSGLGVSVYGLTYKPDIDDLRNSPAAELIALLKEAGAEPTVFDPYHPDKSDVSSLQELMAKHPLLIIATDHQPIKALQAKAFSDAGIKTIIDTRNCLDKKAILAAGITYRGVGR